MTENELHEILKTQYGLKKYERKYKVRDGEVCEGDKVWWRCSTGPEHVTLGESHLSNIVSFPEFYQIAKPICSVEYED